MQVYLDLELYVATIGLLKLIPGKLNDDSTVILQLLLLLDKINKLKCRPVKDDRLSHCRVSPRQEGNAQSTHAEA